MFCVETQLTMQKDFVQLLNEVIPQGPGFPGEQALLFLIGSATLGGLNGNGFIPEPGEIVGAGTHVDFACFQGEVEALPEKIT